MYKIENETGLHSLRRSRRFPAIMSVGRKGDKVWAPNVIQTVIAILMCRRPRITRDWSLKIQLIVSPPPIAAPLRTVNQ